MATEQAAPARRAMESSAQFRQNREWRVQLRRRDSRKSQAEFQLALKAPEKTRPARDDVPSTARVCAEKFRQTCCLPRRSLGGGGSILKNLQNTNSPTACNFLFVLLPRYGASSLLPCLF